MNQQATDHQDEIIRSRETLERLHDEQNGPASSSSAPATGGLFSREVQEGVRVRGGMIYGDWRGSVLNRMGGMTPNQEARLI